MNRKETKEERLVRREKERKIERRYRSGLPDELNSLELKIQSIADGETKTILIEILSVIESLGVMINEIDHDIYERIYDVNS